MDVCGLRGIVLFSFNVYVRLRDWLKPTKKQKLAKPKKLKIKQKTSFFWSAGTGLEQTDDHVNTPLLGKKTKILKYSEIV